MKNTIGSILIFVGLLVVAGSAGDCDGKCMDQANTLSEMFTAIAIGLGMMIAGGLAIFSENNA